MEPDAESLDPSAVLPGRFEGPSSRNDAFLRSEEDLSNVGGVGGVMYMVGARSGSTCTGEGRSTMAIGFCKSLRACGGRCSTFEVRISVSIDAGRAELKTDAASSGSLTTQSGRGSLCGEKEGTGPVA